MAAGFGALRDQDVGTGIECLRAMSSLCTWQINSAPAALMRGANGLGSPNDSMIARGFASSAMSSSSGRLARLQVMKPMPKGARHAA